MSTTEGTLLNANVTVSSYAVSDEVIQFRFFGLAIGFFTVFVGGIGNILTIATFVTSKKLRTSFVLFLINLSIVDLMTSTLMLPFNIAGYIQMSWPFGNDSWTARLQAYSYFCCGYTSIVFLVAITTNRLVGVVMPSEYKEMFNKRRMRMILAFCWLCAPAFLLPFLVGWHSDCPTPRNALTGFRQSQLLCTFICLTGAWMPYMQTTRVLFQFLPLIYMIFAYGIIFVRMQKQRRLIISHKGSQAVNTNSNNSVVTPNEHVLDIRKPSTITLAKRKREDARMLTISVIICAGFMVTFLPSVIVNLLPNAYHMAASNLSWLNSSLNPIIYAILNKRYRKEYVKTIKSIISKRQLFSTTTSADS